MTTLREYLHIPHPDRVIFSYEASAYLNGQVRGPTSLSRWSLNQLITLVLTFGADI